MTTVRPYLATLVAAALLGTGGALWAQAPSPAAGGSAAASTISVPSAPDEGLKELAPAPGAYRYNPAGRRDPFLSLVKRGGAARDDDRSRAGKGIEGLLISELALQGVIKTVDGYIAFFAGPNGKSYWVKNNQRFYDGQLIAIDATTATFRQEVSDPLNPVKTRDVKKYLYPSEEATQ
jgi:type IV pilus assembly protein PilP